MKFTTCSWNIGWREALGVSIWLSMSLSYSWWSSDTSLPPLPIHLHSNAEDSIQLSILAGSYVAGNRYDGFGSANNFGVGSCWRSLGTEMGCEESKAVVIAGADADRSGVPSLSIIGTSIVELPVKLRTGTRLFCFLYCS